MARLPRDRPVRSSGTRSWWMRRALSKAVRIADGIQLYDEGDGYDAFGANAEAVALAMRAISPLYKYWFRVDSSGHEHIPTRGGGIVVANHSGTLPFDAAMLWADVVQHTHPPRVLRIIADHFVANLPFFNTLVSRTGAIGGSRGNLEELLRRGELVGIFPEGTAGIGKRYRDRYKLQGWRVGHAELALKHRVPVIPAAIIGAEEQMPQLARIPLRPFGAPHIPVALPPFPLPVHYHILYGEPLSLHTHWQGEDHRDPAVIDAAAKMVAGRVCALIDAGLAARKGVFM